MKKIIASIAVLSMCALMLTACGGNNTTGGDSNVTEDITASTAAENNGGGAEAAEAETEAAAADDSAEDGTETETEAADAGSSDAAASYASLEEFIRADDIFNIDGDLVDGENTNTYKFISTLDTENAEGFYIDIEAADGSMKATMAAAEKKIAVYMSGSGINMSVIMKDGMMYMILPDSKKAVYTELDEEAFAASMEQYSAKDILGENIDTDASDITGMASYTAEIGGETYTFEYMDDVGFLFDNSGKLCTVVNGQANADVPAFIINEFTLNIPADAFDVPSGYEVVDVASLDESELMELFETMGLLG